MKPTSRLIVLKSRLHAFLSTLGNRVNMLVVLIGAIVTLHGLALLLQPESILSVDPRGGLSPGGRALYQLGMTGGIAWELGWWWTIVSASYLHGGLVHLIPNLFYVYALGAAVVSIYGHARMFVLFNVGGASGFLLSNAVAGGPTIGASGGYFGFAAGLLLYGRRCGTSAVATWLWWCCLVMVVFMAFIPFALPRFNGWVNVGGLIGGWITALFLSPKDKSRESIVILALQFLFATALVVGVGLSFWQVNSILLAE